MKVDLPAPGGPEMPMRTAPPASRQHRFDQAFGLIAMLGPRRFDKSDGPRQGPPVTLPQSLLCNASPSSLRTGIERRAVVVLAAHALRGGLGQDLVDDRDQLLDAKRL